MKDRRIVIFLAGLVILSAALLFINFHLAVSNTKAEHNIITTSSGDRLPEAMQSQEKITVAVIGEGPLVSALQKTVPAALSNAGTRVVELSRESEDAYENPVLLIKVGEPAVLWTPVFAISESTIEVGYASNGDTTFMSDAAVVYESKDGPTINMTARYNLSDWSWGILSHPGYYQILADWLTRNIVETTNKLYAGKTP